MPLLIRLLTIFIKSVLHPIEALVIFHSVFNVIGVLIFMPFLGKFSKFLEIVVKDKKNNAAKFINADAAKMTDSALIAMKKEIVHLYLHVLHHNLRVMEIEPAKIIENNDFSKYDKIQSLTKDYESIKLLQSEILTFAAAILMKELSKIEHSQLDRLQHVLRLMVHSAKSIKDIRHNLLEFESEDNVFVNGQYYHFKERISELYSVLAIFLANGEYKKGDSTIILQLLEKVKNDDKLFL